MPGAGAAPAHAAAVAAVTIPIAVARLITLFMHLSPDYATSFFVFRRLGVLRPQ
jgi:hypothetical protein